MKNVNILTLFKSWNFDYKPYVEKFKAIGDVTAIRYKKGKPFRRNYDRGMLLFAVASHFRCKTFLEFGTGRGYVTACVSLCKSIEHIITIDRDPVAKKTLVEAGIDTKNIDFITSKSQKLKQGDLPEVDLAFIDGEHSYDAVENDLSLTRASIVVFDDFRNKHKGVKKFIKSLKVPGKEKVIISTDGWIYKNEMLTKHGDADKIVNGKELGSGQVILLDEGSLWTT